MKNQGDVFEFNELGKYYRNNPENFWKIVVIILTNRKKLYFLKKENNANTVKFINKTNE